MPGRCARPPNSRSASCSRPARVPRARIGSRAGSCFMHDAPTDRTVHARMFGRERALRSGFQWHRLLAARPRRRQPARRSDDGTLRAAVARKSQAARRRGRSPTQVRQLVVMQLSSGQLHDRPRGTDAARRPPHDSSAAAQEAANLQRRSWTRCVANSRTRYLAERKRTLAEISARCSASRLQADSRAGTGSSSARPVPLRARRDSPLTT